VAGARSKSIDLADFHGGGSPGAGLAGLQAPSRADSLQDSSGLVVWRIAEMGSGIRILADSTENAKRSALALEPARPSFFQRGGFSPARFAPY
jgi:hypothetical protein